MEGLQDDDHDNQPRRFTAPYGKANPIPTVSGYRQIQKDRAEQEGLDTSKSDGARGTLKRIFVGDKPGEGDEEAQGWAAKGQNRNIAASRQDDSGSSKPDDNADESNNNEDEADRDDDSRDQDKPIDTSQAVSNEADPKARRKAMKGRDPEKDSKSREVTDPVTHLPIKIHDFTEKELNEAPSNLPEFGSKDRLTRRPTGDDKTDAELQATKEELDSGYEGMQRLFPPPSFDAFKKESAQVYRRALIFSLATSAGALFSASGLAFWLVRRWDERNLVSQTIGISAVLVLVLSGLLASYVGSKWLTSRLKSIWDDETWAAARKEERKLQSEDYQIPESSMWLNFVIAAIWPLINPDLFNSLVDTLEDVMQASLPKIVRMIAIEDFGQGKSAIRILGVRSLPAGAAGKSVSKDGKVKENKKGDSDRDTSNQGQVDNSEKEDPSSGRTSEQKEQQDANEAEGLEAESGDFLNLEIAFSYRATKGKGLKQKSQNAHLYLVFYLPSNIPVPVWVAVDGIVGIVRMRIQTAPDPPFINLCTLSFMGQPKASISCVPLIKKGPNLMDIPFLSSFVQSSVDAALAEYVAPKSITLDLKQMLQGDDFKKDTTNRGMLLIKIHSASGMEGGDTKIPLIKDGSSDCYISCGWAKFSKPMWSTRIIVGDMEPSFEEHCMLLVGPGELNADERLRVQLWDSDRTSADDDLGRVEVDLDELMKSDQSRGKMWQREDRFVDLDGKSEKPGTLKWEVGYFEKVSITQDQFENQSINNQIKSLNQLKEAVNKSTKKKLREAPEHVREQEASQQRKQEFYEQETELICAAPPPYHFPSGILSVQIHNAQGLEIARLNKKTHDEEDEDDTGGEDELPSPYCSIIVNGKVVYKTRTKPKNSNPFFNAGTERFVRDWSDTEIIVAVRDARVHEDDPLLGIIHLPLEHVFRKRAQSNETYPLCGGVGYGKLRVSMVFRAIEIKLPRELQGWDYGTIEIGEKITTDDLPEDLLGLRLKLSTSINRAKMRSNKDGSWHEKKDRKVYLTVTKRYASSVLIELRSDKALKDKTNAWAILWLKDIVDDEEKELELTVWRGDQKTFTRARANVLEEMGEKAGTVKLKLTFHAGLHDGHYAIKDSNIKNVLECLAVASENREIEVDEHGIDDSDSSSDSSDSSNDEEEDQSKGPIDKIKDYKERSGTLHRQHKGVMQWKLARKANWAQSKVTDDLPNKLKDIFSRKGKVQGVETEV